MDGFNIRCKCFWFSEDLLPFHFTDSGIENVSVLSQGILEYGIAYVVKRGLQEFMKSGMKRKCSWH